jgi:hypothetical protein
MIHARYAIGKTSNGPDFLVFVPLSFDELEGILGLRVLFQKFNRLTGCKVCGDKLLSRAAIMGFFHLQKRQKEEEEDYFCNY